MSIQRQILHTCVKSWMNLEDRVSLGDSVIKRKWEAWRVAEQESVCLVCR